MSSEIGSEAGKTNWVLELGAFRSLYKSAEHSVSAVLRCILVQIVNNVGEHAETQRKVAIVGHS